LYRQSQTELYKLQNGLKEEQERNFSLERKLQDLNDGGYREGVTETAPMYAAPKKRKSMFNPNKNRLNAI